jgi:hypothetical protein
MDSGVALNPITDWKKRRIDGSSRNDKMVRLITRAKSIPNELFFAEADHLDVLKLPKLYGKRFSYFIGE